MTTELTAQELPSISSLDRPMTSGDLTKQALLVQEILDKVMVDGVHYGKIPGTDKPTLYQPGAEKICATFHLAPKQAVEDLSEPHNNFYRYRVACSLYTIRDGLFVGAAVGEASSAEEKYQWERAVCQEHFDATDPSRRRVKYKKDGDGFSTVNQVQRNGADLANTVLKMAAKRAFISAARGATAASDLLDVDLEEEVVADLAKEQRAEQPIAKPKAKPKPAPMFNYGKFKGRQITDPEIPADYLKFMADSTASQLDDPAKAKFKAQNQLFLIALDAEIAFRRSKEQKPTEPPPGIPPQNVQAAPGEVQTGKAKETPMKPITDTAWAEFINFWETDWFDLYTLTKEEFGAASGHDVLKEERQKFYDRINTLITQAKKK